VSEILQYLFGGGIIGGVIGALIAQIATAVRARRERRRERKGLLRLLYTEVAQNKYNIDYVVDKFHRPATAESVLAMRGRYVTAEAWKEARVPLSQNISSKPFAVLSDYYKNLLLLEEVVTKERASKDRDAGYETSKDTIYKTRFLLEGLVKLQSELIALIETEVPGVTARDTFAEIAQKQELPNPPNSQN
jgi:hypothetical protein